MMGRRYLMVDCGSGLGGASEPMVQHPDWDVIRIDISELVADVPHTYIKDILDKDFISWIKNLILNTWYVNRKIDLLWFSPPCTEFSLARQPQIANPSLAIVKRCIQIKNALNPYAWIIENVKGAQKHFLPLLGVKRSHMGPYYFWGDYPHFYADIRGHSKYLFEGKEPWSTDPLRPFKRAYVPWTIGECLRQSIQYQSTLDSFSATKAKRR